MVGEVQGGAGTMCDFYNFGLIFAAMHSLPQRLKSMLFEIFSNGGYPKSTWSENETKIVKITHSAHLVQNFHKNVGMKCETTVDVIIYLVMPN